MNWKAGLIPFLFITLFAIPSACQSTLTNSSDTDSGTTDSGTPETYQATWESLKKHPTPDWFRDAKFGIFIHWGVYSVPAWAPEGEYAEWYPHRMYQESTETYKYHKKTYGPPSEFGYKDFIPKFRAENWDPDRWAELFKTAGARYVVPVAEHHDGFAMWDSDLTKWDANEMGPKRDIIGELETAVRSRDMKYAPSYHRAMHYWYYTHKEEYDTTNPEYSGLYGTPHNKQGIPTSVLDEWKARWEEIRDKYKPDLMWFDWKWQHFTIDNRVKQMMADYYNTAKKWGKKVAITNKTLKSPPRFPMEAGDLFEMDYLNIGVISRIPWENPRGIGHSYGYNRNESLEKYDSVNALVDLLVDIVSKNGNLLLNVGPKADGTIPEIQRNRLKGIGQWLDTNGEAIYGTRPWSIWKERFVRFTRTEDAVYAICLEWPGDKLRLQTMTRSSSYLPEEIESVRMLGTEGKLEWSRDMMGLKIQMPDQKPGKHAFAIKINHR